jgi:hypothetical protein
MKTGKLLTILAIVIAVLGSSPLNATTRATDYPGSVTILMEISTVRKDLGLSPVQGAKLNVLRHDLKAKAKALAKNTGTLNAAGLTSDQRLFALIDRNNAKALALLTPAQFARFHQIQNQILGYTMLVSPKIQKELRFTPKQTALVEAVRVRGLEFVAQANRSFEEGTMSRLKRVEVLRNYRIEQAAEMKKILTPAQLQSFAALCGQPLKKS